MNPNPLTADERTRIARLLAEGWTNTAIGEAIGRHEATVRRAVKALGGRRARKKVCALEGCGHTFLACGSGWAGAFCCREYRAKYRRQAFLARHHAKKERRPQWRGTPGWRGSRPFAAQPGDPAEARAVGTLRRTGPVFPLSILDPKADPELWLVWGRRRTLAEMIAMADAR